MSQANTPKLISNVQVIQQAGLIHRVQRPEGDGPFPTVVMLHGRAGTEDVMWVFANTLPQNWLVVAPRGIRIDPDGGFDWRPRGHDEWPPLTAFDEAVTAVTRFIHAMPALYNADPEQIYLMGFSQGDWRGTRWCVPTLEHRARRERHLVAVKAASAARMAP